MNSSILIKNTLIEQAEKLWNKQTKILDFAQFK